MTLQETLDYYIQQAKDELESLEMQINSELDDLVLDHSSDYTNENVERLSIELGVTQENLRNLQFIYSQFQ